ncbi:unnamed protein product [Prorocentrum cordatum]|uniref:Chlorophyll a-b binding protein, chloroplastic n=1 Tax=Prorocentrum cordatum TaxID=2364126 RepID=A0ABN9PHM8_9DINO|nr:unnamed protein product [Polarella glacialis]
MLNAVVANGWLAGMGNPGMPYQGGLVGGAWGDWARYTGSLLRAFVSESDIQVPGCFWNPAGFTTDGDAASTAAAAAAPAAAAASGGPPPPQAEAVAAGRGAAGSPPRAFEGALGVPAPVGHWDPLGLAQDCDADVSYRRRCTESKHGRVAMLAARGYIAPEFLRWPGGVACDGLAFEALNGIKGDGSAVPERRMRSLNAELPNGRRAMMAIIGSLLQDGLTGSARGEWATYTDPPPRAVESVWGLETPVSATGTRSALQRTAVRASSTGAGAPRSSTAALPRGPPWGASGRTSSCGREVWAGSAGPIRASECCTSGPSAGSRGTSSRTLRRTSGP